MRDTKTATTLCQNCPKLCRFSCPVADADRNESTTPWGKMTAMKLVEEKKLPMTAETMALAYKCLNCRLSQEVCELDNPVSSVLDTYRVRAFRAGLAPEGVVSYCEKFGKENNPFGKDLLRELQKRFPEKLKGKRKTVYFPGCTEIAREPATIAGVFELLETLKAKEVGLYTEPIQCCGYPLFAAGDWDNFAELAEVNSNALRDYALIITGAPACLYTMETLYRSAGHPTSAKFVHIVEYLASRLNPPTPPLTKGGKGGFSVAYHDPCYLGRYRKTYEAPRKLIEMVSGKAPREFSRNREASYCCGAGGLLPVSSPETAEKITGNRIEEFKRTGADLLVSACPTCVQRFKKFGVRAKNLVDYLKEGMVHES